MKGLLIFYVKFPADASDDDMKQTYRMIRSHNEDLFKSVEEEGYKIMFHPTFLDSCHVERVELSSSFDIGGKE